MSRFYALGSFIYDRRNRISDNQVEQAFAVAKKLNGYAQRVDRLRKENESLRLFRAAAIKFRADLAAVGRVRLIGDNASEQTDKMEKAFVAFDEAAKGKFNDIIK